MFPRPILALALALATRAEPTLDQDDECLANGDCSLSALQRRAMQARAESKDAFDPNFDIPSIGDLPSEDEMDNMPEDEGPEDDEQDEEAEDHEEHAEEGKGDEDKEPNQPYTGPTMAPLPANPPTPIPPTVQSVSPIVVRGNFLYDSVTGDRFFAKGVAYNPRNEHYDKSFGPSVKVEGWVDHCVPGHPKGGEWSYTEDVIADEHEDAWSVDLEAIADLGANTLRLYNVNPQNNHSKFMQKALSLGLYVIVPLNGKDWGYLPAFPSPDCYTQEIEGYGNVGVNALSFAKQVIQEFSQYNNTLLFTVANEMAQNDKNGWAAFPCVKALTRDVHRYQASCGQTMRRVPLIYSDVDMGAGDRGDVAAYLTCAVDSEDDAVDVYGLNVYSWCDEAYPGAGKADNFQYSPYYEIKKDFKDMSVPFLFTEFGCNLGQFKTKCPYPGGRQWPEVKHLMGSDMGEMMSGAIAFQFSMDKEEYGLTLSPNFLANQTKLYLLDNYFALQKVFKKYDVNPDWNAPASEVLKCGFVPSDVHKMEFKHPRPKCPAESVWLHIMKKHRTDTISNWTLIPPTPNASLTGLWNVGKAECPSGAVKASVLENNCCHFECKK